MSVRALHSAARRYCLQRQVELWDTLELRFQFFTAVSAPLPEPKRTEAFQMWARYHIVGTILRAIERSLPRDFATTQGLREHLAELGATVQDRWSESFKAQADRSSMEQERARFVAHVSTLTDQQATSLPLLPSRRVLGPGERQRMMRRIRKRWPSDQDTWHPLAILDHQSDILHAQSAWFNHEVPVEEFRQAIARHGDPRIWELHEGPHFWDKEPSQSWVDYELEPGLFWPDASETIWVPRDLDWLVYVDHDEGIYFAGKWLVSRIKDLWPNWQQRLWTDYGYVRPQRNGLTPQWKKPPGPNSP